MPTVLVCDDSSLARETLRHAVAAVPGVDRVLEASSGEEALARWGAERPDVTLMDVRMPGLGGVEATRRLLAVHPDASVVMLTMGEDVEGVARAVKAGACGYVVKDSSGEELAATVSYVLTAGLDRRAGRRATASSGAGDSLPILSDREQQVLDGMARGQSNAEIGRELYLSEDTVKTHARRLFRKVGASDRAHAVAIGFRRGLVR